MGHFDGALANLTHVMHVMEEFQVGIKTERTMIIG